VILPIFFMFFFKFTLSGWLRRTLHRYEKCSKTDTRLNGDTKFTMQCSHLQPSKHSWLWQKPDYHSIQNYLSVSLLKVTISFSVVAERINFAAQLESLAEFGSQEKFLQIFHPIEIKQKKMLMYWMTSCVWHVWCAWCV